mmetsp:Transcript_65054/g.79604  ORF Transcript_65054/g.79604 Transcript_65054/m.79604 type:complete len:170 (-) Transcript_65054:87-596(-)
MARTKLAGFKMPARQAMPAVPFGGRTRSRTPQREQGTEAAVADAGDNKATAEMLMKLRDEPVVVKSLRPGDGKTFPKEGDEVVMHFKGSLLKGGAVPPFDCTWSRQAPFTCRIGVGEVIRGWDEGLVRMSQGEKAMLGVRSDFAFGKAGAGSIPPNSNLCYEIELLKVG